LRFHYFSKKIVPQDILVEFKTEQMNLLPKKSREYGIFLDLKKMGNGKKRQKITEDDILIYLSSKIKIST
jgi:hypothetical protein